MQQNVENILPPPRAFDARRFNYDDYRYGRTPLHPLLYGKRQRFFSYGTKITSANSAGIAQINIERDSHFLVEAIQAWSPTLPTAIGSVSSFRYSIQDLSYGKPWSNNLIPLLDGTGLGSNAKFLTDPLLVRPNTLLQINTATGAESVIYLALIGRKIYGVSDDEWRLINKKQFYTYILRRASNISAGGAEFILTVQVFNEADFVLKRILSSQIEQSTFIQSQSANDDVNPIWNVRSTAADKSIHNKKISMLLNQGFMAGIINSEQTATIPALSYSFGNAFPMRRPVKIPRNSIIEVRLANPSPTTVLTGSFNITFEGIHVYD